MSESEQPQPTPQADDDTLGKLDASSAGGSVGLRRSLPPPPPEPVAPLPRGAWLRLEVSGGLVFRSTIATLFNDGRLTYRQSAWPGNGELLLVRRLTDEQLADCRTTVEQIDLAELAEHEARLAGGDRLSYALTVRHNRKTYNVEALQGALPEALATIVRKVGEMVRVAAEETSV